MPRGRRVGWSERGEQGGRPKGSVKPVEEHKMFKHLSIYCSVEEVEQVKEKAKKMGKPVGRYLIDLALKQDV